ncbi:MAG: hypothetical protein ACO1SV_17640 [Fimbriimonas sp.]
MIWADRAGILCQFLSFWLVAPELLGHARLARLRRALSRVVQAMILVPVGAVGVVGGSALAFAAIERWEHSAARATFVGFLVALVLLWIYWSLRQGTLPRLLERLENRETFRGHLATLGAVLFTIGFILQMVATWG